MELIATLFAKMIEDESYYVLTKRVVKGLIYPLMKVYFLFLYYLLALMNNVCKCNV